MFKRLASAVGAVIGGVILALASHAPARRRPRAAPAIRWEPVFKGARSVGAVGGEIDIPLENAEWDLVFELVLLPPDRLAEAVRRLGLPPGSFVATGGWAFDPAVEILLACRQRGIGTEGLRAVVDGVAREAA